MNKVKVAICLRGAVAKVSGTFFTSNSLYRDGNYINIQACANSIQKHIIQANPEYECDFFIHSWNQDLENDLTKLYQPKSLLFEDNKPYVQEISNKTRYPNDFSGVSHSLSIKKSIELAEEYQKQNSFTYDLFVLYRPDLIILKDIKLNNYDKNKIYCNGPKNANGDFHFIMNANYANQFKNLYHSIEKGNPCIAHFWMKNYVNKYMKQPLYEDDIIAGIDEEVIRKIFFTSINIHKVPINKFLPYGLTVEEIKTYDKP